MPETVKLRIENGIGRLTLARPDVRNAIDDAVMAEMSAGLAQLARADAVRVVVLDAEGDAFCAGTDVSWMEHLAADRQADDARRLASLLYQLRMLPKPLVARVQGAAIGAGVALAACADIVVASEDAFFALPAVRLGAVPAVIGPFVIEAIGLNQARRYLLTGERFDAMTARRLGLVHLVCLPAHLEETLEGVLADLLEAGPHALRESKHLLTTYGQHPLDQQLLQEAAKISARVRKDSEAREGLAAFLEKRPPSWLR